MNKTYRSIWNASLGCYVAAPECASSHLSGTSATRVVRCREPLRSGIPMVLESRVLFDGAMVATVIEQDSASDAPVVDEVEPEAEEVTVAEAPAQPAAAPAEDDEPAPEADADDAAAEEAVAEEAVAEEPVAGEAAAEESDTPLATPDTAEAPSVEVVFVDARVPDVASFEAPGREVIVLSMEQDGIGQIATALNGRTGIDAIHIVSHGGDGFLSLGSSQVTADSIQSTQLQYLQAIGQSLSADGDILIYACDYASGESGLEAMNLLADITGADVAASVDTTGNVSRGGDWVLEQSVGDVDAQMLDLPSWEGELRTLTGAELVANLQTSGQAQSVPGNPDMFQLTADALAQAGAAQSTFEINLATDFVFEFQVYLGTNDGSGADGITFVMHNDPAGAGAMGVMGGGLGALGIQNGVVIEFDTYDNGAPIDIEADHTAMWDSDSGSSMSDITYLTGNTDLGNIENDAWHNVIVTWSAATETLSYSFNGVSMGSASNLVSDGRFGGGNVVHFGWTAATGGASNLQQVRLSSFTGDLNFAPVAVDDSFSVDEDSVVGLGGILANDSDPDGDEIYIDMNSAAGSGGGQFSFDDSGILIFNPNGDFDDLAVGQSRTTGFTYTLYDSNGASSAATVTVTVNGANDNPQGTDDSFVGDEDSVLVLSNLVGNDTDAEGDALYMDMNSTAGSNGGLFSRDDGGSVSFNPNGDFDDLAVGESRTTSFSYTVYDDQGGSGTATVTVTVNGLNDNPTGVNDQYFASEDGLTNLGSLMANDSDVEGDGIYVDLNSTPGGNGGQFSVDDGGSVVFNPDGDFDDLAVGESRDTSFNYMVYDDQGGQSSATVTVTVHGVNDNPVGVDDEYQVFEDGVTPLSSPLANDHDAEGNELSAEVNGLDGNNGGAISMGDAGELSFNADGDFDDLATGESRTTSFTYTVRDSEGGSAVATVTVTVHGSNDNPLAGNDAFTTQADTASFLGNLLNNDGDPEDDAVSVETIDGNTGSSGGIFTLDAAGALHFNPNGNFDDLAVGESRETSATYTLLDAFGGSSTGTVTVTVEGVSVTPVDPVDPGVGDGETGGNPVDPVDHSNEIVFVDPRVSDPDAFQAGGREVILLTLDEDGLAQIAAALNGRTGIEAIHIISHGAEGTLTLGNAQVNAASMQGTQLLSLQAIGQSLTLNGDILVYACDFAAGEMGLAAMSVLADITVADVAASLYITGHETLGADWSLEARVGTVEADEVVPNNWVYALNQASLGTDPVSSPAVAAAPEAERDGVVAAQASPAAPVEAVVVSPAVTDVAFTGTPVRVSSMATATLARHEAAAGPAGLASEPGVQPILGFRMLDLETAFRQSLASATLAEPALVDALIEVGVETTPEWTQQHAAATAADQPAAHWVDELATTDVLDQLSLEDVVSAEGEAEVAVTTRPHAAQGFKAQLARWAQWPAQRPITRAAVHG
jgi:VCBS repeat-containing protein